MRLIHTADVHLDACFASAGLPARYANRRRQSLRDVFAAIVRRAGEWPADALIIAGDLFDLERVTRDTVAFLKAQFESIGPLPVVIAPGNHDPFLAASPYSSEFWPDNVRIFSRPAWQSFALHDGQLIVHGFAFDGYEISCNPFDAFSASLDGGIHVVLGHGTERRHQPPDGKSYAPFDIDSVVRPGVDYVALGHFHALTPIDNGLRVPAMYSGAPEGHDFGEQHLHYYVEVEFGEGPARVTPVPCARVIHTTHIVECEGVSTAQQLTEAVRALAGKEAYPQIARVTLRGECSPWITAEIPSVHDAVAQEFEHLIIVDETHPSEDYEGLAKETTTLGLFVRRLNEEIADAPDSAKRRILERARVVGLAAYRDYRMPIGGIDTEAIVVQHADSVEKGAVEA